MFQVGISSKEPGQELPDALLKFLRAHHDDEHPQRCCAEEANNSSHPCSLHSHLLSEIGAFEKALWGEGQSSYPEGKGDSQKCLGDVIDSDLSENHPERQLRHQEQDAGGGPVAVPFGYVTTEVRCAHHKPYRSG